jgi:two-component system response regulator NreC
MADTIKVFICDDHTIFREGIKAIFRDEPSIEVIGEADDGRQGLHKIVRLHPHVVLMDIAMPDLSGFEATRRIRQASENIQVIILTMYEEEEVVARCLDAGASGYVLKDASLNELVQAINIVNSGGQYLSPRVLKKVVSQYVKGGRRTETSYDRLSDREREVLKLLADGLSIKEIAAHLNLSVKTVDAHKYNLMRKLDVHDRAELIKYAIQRKLIRLPAMN